MSYLIAGIFAVIALEWGILPHLTTEQSWYVLLGTAKLSAAIGITMAAIANSHRSVWLHVTLTAVMCLMWANFLSYVLWSFGLAHINNIAIAATFMLIWIYQSVSRNYELKGDRVNHDNVMLLFKRPAKIFDSIHSSVGAPYSSVCVVANGNIWSFRKKSNKYEIRPYSSKILKTHVAVDTGVKADDDILKLLRYKIGYPRGIGCRCVFVIRDFLTALGDRWKPRTFELLPSLYAFRILRDKYAK